MKRVLLSVVWWLLALQLRMAARVMRGLGEHEHAVALDRDARALRGRGRRHMCRLAIQRRFRNG